MTITEVELGIPEGMVDSHIAAEMLNISHNNLRQIVWRKILVPSGKYKRKSLFNITDVERVKVLRKPSIPSA
jgi:hypothetical protein